MGLKKENKLGGAQSMSISFLVSQDGALVDLGHNFVFLHVSKWRFSSHLPGCF